MDVAEDASTLVVLVQVRGFTAAEVRNRSARIHAEIIISELILAVSQHLVPWLSHRSTQGDRITLVGRAVESGGDVLPQFFEKFHHRLMELQASNICRCPACLATGCLVLQVFAHLGADEEEVLSTGLEMLHRHDDPRPFIKLSAAARAKLTFGSALEFSEEDQVWSHYPEGFSVDEAPYRTLSAKVRNEWVKIKGTFASLGKKREDFNFLDDE